MSAPFTRDTFYDLGAWLSQPDNYSEEQLARLQDEDLCLPLITLAHQHWLMGELAHQLKNSQVWELLPEQLQTYLLEIEAAYLQRSQALVAESMHACELLTQADIEVVLLKGAASLFNGVASPISTRYMKDIDILVPEGLQQQAMQVLLDNAYQLDEDYYAPNADVKHHLTPVKRNEVCYIEIHRWVTPLYLQSILPTKQVWENVVPLNLSQSITVKELSPTHQVVLSILHSEITNKDYDLKRIDLLQLVHLARIIQQQESQINWEEIRKAFQVFDLSEILQNKLYVLHEFMHLNTPITQLDEKKSKAFMRAYLSKLEKSQGKESVGEIIKEQLIKYKYRNVMLTSHGSSMLYYVWGVTKQALAHLGRVLNVFNLKSYIARLGDSFNRSR